MFNEDTERVEHKKPRLPNACKNCRLKKVKCDSAIRPDNICSNCIASKTECTREPVKKRGPRMGNPQRSIQATVDAILSTRKPFEVPKDPAIVKGIFVDLANCIKDLEEDIAGLRQTLSTPLSHENPLSQTSLQPNREKRIAVVSQYPDYPSPPPVEGYSVNDLTRDLKTFGYYEDRARHFGSSSSRKLVKDALDVKKEYTGGADFVNVKPSFKRLEFWSVQPWQKTKSENPPPFEFPPDDLMTDLIQLYFTQFNPLLPLLHHPSFLRNVAEGLYYKDRHFGGLVLAVCALGARFSNDPRVVEDYTTSEQSIGWKWIRQIQPIRHSFTEPPSIYEIQLYTVYTIFMGATTTPEVCWILISTGIRLLQDVGAHRRRPTNSKPSWETESWKRAFWFMYSIDILASTLLGRPRSMSQNDCDADLPIECDDEYWEHPDPKLAFQQPFGNPSIMSYWIHFLKLMNIADLTLHTILAVKQSDMWSAAFGLSKREWNEKTVSELDSLLNKWADEIPDHLKWDPSRENIQHFNESVVLYTTYYGIQILIHRSFIPRPGEDSHSTVPSLAICANAARSCLHVLEVEQQRKTNAFVIPSVMIALFNSAIVMLVNMWIGKHFVGSSPSGFSKDLAAVYRAINTLHRYELRWEQAGRLADILTEVISVSHFHKSSQPMSSMKRPREDERNMHTYSSTDPDFVDNGQRHNDMIAGNDMGTPYLPTIEEHPRNFELPLNSGELGSLPIHEPFLDWSVPSNQWVSNSENENALDSWAATVPNDTNQFGFYNYSTSSESITNFPSTGSGEEPLDNRVPNDLDDWTSYIAAIDEILQAANPRVVP
ncbi:fungal-specific transcription factor domain-containing protein [Lentinula edodes]|nr:fungal-specific transcription factor domain-containing protein [Lentinula edodes]